MLEVRHRRFLGPMGNPFWWQGPRPDLAQLANVSWQAMDDQGEGSDTKTSGEPIDGDLTALGQVDRVRRATLRHQIGLAMSAFEEGISCWISAVRIEGSIFGGFAVFFGRPSCLPFFGLVPRHSRGRRTCGLARRAPFT